MRRRRHILPFGIIIVLAFVMFFGGTVMAQRFREFVFHGIGPMVRLGHHTARALAEELATNTTDYIDAGIEASSSKKTAFDYEELKKENERLHRMLKFRERTKLSVHGSEVVFYGRELDQEFFFIRSDDYSYPITEETTPIKEGQAVIESNGMFVGIVKRVGGGYARVDVASNIGETFEATLLPAGATVLVEGIGGRSFIVKLIPRQISFEDGDFIAYVTGKYGNRPLLFGEVVRIKKEEDEPFQEAHAVLIPHPELLTEVFVLSSVDPTIVNP